MNHSTDADRSQEATAANPCPPWCTDHQEESHATTDKAAGPILVRLFQGPGDGPTVDLVRDARDDDHDRPLTPAEARTLTGHLAHLTALTATAPPPGADPRGEVARPWWLPGGCPSWCEWPDTHEGHDHYVDRLHMGARVSVTLTATEDSEPTEYDDPREAGAYIVQHYREAEPRIELVRDDAPMHVQLTADEAEEFAMKLLELAATARTR